MPDRTKSSYPEKLCLVKLFRIDYSQYDETIQAVLSSWFELNSVHMALNDAYVYIELLLIVYIWWPVGICIIIYGPLTTGRKRLSKYWGHLNNLKSLKLRPCGKSQELIFYYFILNVCGIDFTAYDILFIR